MSTNAHGAPSVTVIIPAFNSAAHLNLSVGSVLRQTFADFELLVVDDGSKENTLEVARSIAAGDARMSVLQHPGGVNRGVSATRNVGIARARGRYVAFLDADDAWHPEKLEAQVAYMERNPEFALTYTRARIIRSGKGAEFTPGAEYLGNVPPRAVRQAMESILLISTNYIFSTVMARTEAVRAVGGFIEGLPFQSEDRILVTQIASRHRVGLVQRCLCDYHAHDASYTSNLIASGKVAAVMYDMQARVVLWLSRQPDREEWALSLAKNLLPGHFVAAWNCAGDAKTKAILRARTQEVIARFPSLLPCYVAGGLRHSRLGALFKSKAGEDGAVPHETE